MKMDIYSPAEDSYLLSEALTDYLDKKDKKIKILDMGSGSGIQAETCKKLGFKNILCADINSNAVTHLKKQGFDSIKTDLFEKLYKRRGDLLGETLVPIRFDLIIFNPPYLPEDKYDKEKDTTAGRKGYELILKFLEEAKEYLDKNGEILLLFSSFSKPKIILRYADKIGYNSKLLAKKRIFFEELFVYLFEPK